MLVVLCAGEADFSMAELDEISRRVGSDWERLAIYLGVTQDRIDQIKYKSNDIMTRSFLALWWWREQGGASRQGLAQALRKIDKGRLASEVHTAA